MKQWDLWHRQEQSIAQGALTNSKHPKAHVKGVYPTHITAARGCKVWGDDGNAYVDFICALGANLLGYGNETVNRAMTSAMSHGYSHSLPTQYEVLAAEKVKELVPFVDRVKFVKTGSDACTAALKMARATTGRELVLSDGYHGFHDEFCDVYNGRMDGRTLALKDFRAYIPQRRIAAVIIEPIITDWSEKRVEWLRELATLCHETGTVLIWDEVITGFRWPKFTVAQWASIRPDLICLGKAMANGMPIACVAGRREIMDDASYFVSSTYAGEILSLSAAIATMSLLQGKREFDLDRLWQQGMDFIARFNELGEGLVAIDGYPTRGVFVSTKGDPVTLALFFQEAVKARLLFGKSFFFNFQHAANDIDKVTLKAVEPIFGRIREGRVTLEGELPTSPLAVKVRS
jgi:glutamate-1-semialdehyde 2,1-aminomutase